jgi:hypothetical protein
MFLADTLTLGQPRRTKEGYMAVRARSARAGIYDYLGREVDPEGTHFAADANVKVWRPEAEVFATDAVRSFLLKPITDDHPAKPVTAENWKDVAKGVNAGAMRDGEYLAFDLVLMDAGLIDAVESGKRELSNGYSSEIQFTPGTTDTGEEFDAIQKSIRGNHIAVVDKGRAGPLCRIADAVSAPNDFIVDGQTYSAREIDDKSILERSDASSFPGGGRTPADGGSRMATKLIMVDGLQVETTDAGEAAIVKLQGQIATLTDAKTASETKVGELTAAVATKDGEVAALKQQLADAAVTPAKLEQLVADRSKLVDAAKKIVPALVTDGKTDVEIRKEVVATKLGDAAKDFDDNAILGAFGALSVAAPTVDPVRTAITNTPIVVGDAKAEYFTARDKQKAALADAWKTPANAA